ncbi:MAG: hypothetical protein U0V70_20675 [Terriglobia bacterium]
MWSLTRREFLKTSTAVCLLPSAAPREGADSLPSIKETGHGIEVRGENYTWKWSSETDEFQLLDSHDLVIAKGLVQPAIVIQPAGQKGMRHCQSGKPARYSSQGNRLGIRYEGVNGTATLSVTWRFEVTSFWLEPVIYETAGADDVVALHYFAQGSGDAPRPTMESDYVVLPGVSSSSVMSPILLAGEMGLNVNQVCWLGRGWTGNPDVLQIQAWGLPVHYFCGFHLSPFDYQKTPSTKLTGIPTQELLNAFCCGLAEVPNADLFFETAHNRYGPILSYRSDLWGHLRGPRQFNLGAPWCWTVAPNFYEAIRGYYLALVKAGIIQKKMNSEKKNAVALAPSFDTWGEQYGRGQMPPDRFDEPMLLSIYEGMKRSKMNVKMFVIDGYWEGNYGDLRHSAERFPHFEETLERIRSEGHWIGLWAAFMRCSNPEAIGLSTDHMLRLPDGKPFMIGKEVITARPFYIMDCTQPEVQQVLRKLAREFMQRYHPEFVKFDFGYELPSLAAAAPKDMNWAGEKIMLKAMEVVVSALREENPDVVVMYYSLSPLFVDYFDLHSPDDLGFCAGDFELEANRRFFFSSLLGEIGMPTWGSSGYEWLTAPDIWFDSSAIGTPGNLTSFSGPDPKALAIPERVAKFNGLTHVIRTSNLFSPILIDGEYQGPARGAHASSWARVEDGEVVLVALRERRLDGRKGAGHFRELVSCNTSVVVASTTSQGIEKTARLAVVPFGDGVVTLKRNREVRSVLVTEHYFGGGKQSRSMPVQNARLQLSINEKTPRGDLVEWIEITSA